MFLSQKFANTRSTKALRDYFALAESQPTCATLPDSAVNKTTVGTFLGYQYSILV